MPHQQQLFFQCFDPKAGFRGPPGARPLSTPPPISTGFAFWAARVAGQRWIRKPMANETPGGTFKRTGYQLHTFLNCFLY